MSGKNLLAVVAVAVALLICLVVSVSIAVVGYFMGPVGRDEVVKQRKDEPPVAKVDLKKSAREFVVPMEGAADMGGIKIGLDRNELWRVSSPEIRKLVVHFTIENTAPTRILHFKPGVIFTSGSTSIADEFGNSYRAITAGLPNEQRIDPGTKGRLRIDFEMPVDGCKMVTIQFDGACLGRAGENIIARIPREAFTAP